jgi:hypothetical protein
MRSALLALALSSGLDAQCVMCNRTAAAQNLARAAVLNSGIAVLFIPPFVILAGFAWYALRRTPQR